MRWILGLIATFAVSIASASLQITNAYATDSSGNAITPQLGVPFYVTILYSVSGQRSPYTLKFTAPSGNSTTQSLSYGVGAPGAYWVRWGTFAALYDAPETIGVASSTGSKFTLAITPQSASAAIETFNPQNLSGSFGMSAKFNRAANELLTWIPLPQTSTFQTIGSVTNAPITVGIATGTGQTIGIQQTDDTSTVSSSVGLSLTASSVRVNSSILRSRPMSDLSDVAAQNSPWLAAEPQIESTNRSIEAFAKNASKGFSSKSAVYDVAEAVYSAILKRSKYAVTGKMPDALYAFETGKGECGDLSALFVASCRSLGIPSRPISGFFVGDNQWHVWAEFLVPNQGWVPVDPAYALGVESNNPYPLYFGVIPDMQNRVGLCTGFEQTVGGNTSVFLQAPEVFWFQSGLSATATAFSHLQAAPAKV